MKHILFCSKCRSYTLHKTCECGGEAKENKPPKYSPKDKYGHYRREALLEERKANGLL